MQVSYPDMEKKVREEKLPLERTPHGLPIPSAYALQEAGQSPDTKVYRLLKKVSSFLLLIIFISYAVLFFKPEWTVPYAGSVAVPAFLIYVFSFYMLRRSSHSRLSHATYVVESFYEPVLASLPEAPSAARVEGFDPSSNFSAKFFGLEPSEVTSKLLFDLPSFPGVEFSFREKLVHSTGGRNSAETRYRAFCMYASARQRGNGEGLVMLFESPEGDSSDPVVKRIEQELGKEGFISKRPEWAFFHQYNRFLSLGTGHLRELNAVKLSKGEILIRVTVKKVDEGQEEALRKGLGALLKAVRACESAGAL